MQPTHPPTAGGDLSPAGHPAGIQTELSEVLTRFQRDACHLENGLFQLLPDGTKKGDIKSQLIFMPAVSGTGALTPRAAERTSRKWTEPSPMPRESRKETRLILGNLCTWVIVSKLFKLLHRVSFRGKNSQPVKMREQYMPKRSDTQ